MKRDITLFTITAMLALCSCAKQESAEAPKPAAEAPTPTAEAPAPTQPPGGPHAIVHLRDGSKVPGTIVASSQADMVVAGDDGIERKIPLGQVKSVEYEESQPKQPSRQASRGPTPPKQPVPQQPMPRQTAERPAEPPAPAPPAPPPVVARTYELPAGSEVSVRTNEAIDSATANEGQTFDAVITRDAQDADGAVVIPRGSGARIVIKSASKGDRFHNASDLVLDLQSVIVNGKEYTIDTAEVAEKGKSGIGANKRTAVYTGGGAAIGAIIGAIAGGGKGAAIGAGAGAGAGALTQIITKGGSIKVPVESVLTFKLDKPLTVTVAQ